MGATNAAADTGAWRALNAAYDANYWRAYELSPTNKRVSRDEQQTLTTMLVEGANLLGKRLRERNVDVETLEPKPLEMLANGALRAWFDKSGTNKHLRKVSHCMRSLLADLPRCVHEAVKVLVEQHKPKPAPRRVVALVSAMGVGRHVARDKPKPTKLPMPTFRPWHTLVERPSTRVSFEVDILPETRRILEGLSTRSALREFGTHVPLATELAMLAREHNAAPEHVDRVLDEVNSLLEERGLSSGAVTTTAIFAAAVERFGAANPSERGGET